MNARLASLALHHRTLTAVAVLASAVCACWLHDSSPKTQAEVQGLIMLLAAPVIGHAHRAHNRRERLSRYRKVANVIPFSRRHK